MNLADAIRRAATGSGVHEIALVPEAEAERPEDAAAKPAGPLVAPEPPGPIVAGGSVVRLELFLSPEQLGGLFRSIVANQHTVLTLREAANFLRVNPSALEQMAEARELPALQVDGKWRFSRASLDEWLSMRAAERSTAV